MRECIRAIEKIGFYHFSDAMPLRAQVANFLFVSSGTLSRTRVVSMIIDDSSYEITIEPVS